MLTAERGAEGGACIKSGRQSAGPFSRILHPPVRHCFVTLSWFCTWCLPSDCKVVGMNGGSQPLCVCPTACPVSVHIPPLHAGTLTYLPFNRSCVKV